MTILLSNMIHCSYSAPGSDMGSKLAKMFRETWFFWLFFVCFGFISGRESETSSIPIRAEMAGSVAFSLLVAYWIIADARRRERRMGHGFPALVFFFWPILGPVYLFQTRGARAFLSLLGFAAIFLVGGCLGVAIGMTSLAELG